MQKRLVLDNGMTLIMENTSSVRSVCVGIWVKTGAICETPANNGVSHFIEHMLFKGTKTHSARQIAEAMDSIGGQLNAFSAKEFTCFFAKVRDEHVEMVLKLLADMLKDSLFDVEEIEREKNVVVEEIKMYEDAPDELIHDMFSQALFKNHSIGYPILGTEETVKSLSREDIVGYFNQNYLASNILVTAVGNFKIPRLTSLIKKHFKFMDMRGGYKPKKIAAPEFAINHQIKEKNVEQVHMVIGAPGINELDEDRYKLYILNSIFGGSMSSRLFQEVRENRGLAYSIFSYATLYKFSGLFAVYAGCSYKDCDTVAELILKEIEKIKNDEVSSTELVRAKEQLKGNIILSLESINSRMNRMGRNEIYFNRQVPIDEVLTKIDAINAADVSYIAKKLFKKSKMAVSIIGPADEEKKLSRCLSMM